MSNWKFSAGPNFLLTCRLRLRTLRNSIVKRDKNKYLNSTTSIFEIQIQLVDKQCAMRVTVAYYDTCEIRSRNTRQTGVSPGECT